MLPRLGFSLHFEADRPFHGPAFGGSMLRGAFGAALKRTVCVMRQRDCTGCALEHACIYTTIFETRPHPDAGLMRRYERAPHPFVLAVAPPVSEKTQRNDKGALIARLRLFGDAGKALPFVLKSFEEAGRTGFGAARVPHKLAFVSHDDGDVIWRSGENFKPVKSDDSTPPPLARVTRWRFISPVRLKREGKLVGAEQLEGHDLCMAVVRRLGLLTGFFGAGPLSADFAALKVAALRARITARTLEWHELRRFSARQHMELGMGGLIGELTLDHGGDPELAAALAFAPLIHVGKGATMGLGEVQIDTAEFTMDFAPSAAAICEPVGALS